MAPLLFFPDKSFGIFYILFFTLFGINKYFSKCNNYALIWLIPISIPFFLRFILNGFLISELKELVKITMMVCLVHVSAVRGLFSLRYINAFFIINGVITYLQFFKIPYHDILTNIYIQKNHAIALTWDSVRASGLFSDSASNGVVNLFIFFLYFRLSKNVFAFGSSTVILFSQSKTAILSMILYVFLVVSYRSRIYLISALSGGLLYFKEIIFVRFSQLRSLVENGLGNSSFEARIDNWKYLLNISQNNLANLLIGPGRSEIEMNGHKSSVLDSDYIYILVNFGGLGVISFLLCTIYILISSHVYRKEILAILTLSFALTPLFMPRTFIWLFAVYYVYDLDSSKLQ